MKLTEFSKKQALALTWWKRKATENYSAVICDGAVRSGKTLCMSIGFVLWATDFSSGGSYAICGKTKLSVKRNVITPLLNVLKELGFSCEEKNSEGYVRISCGNVSNRFYWFGGKDEGAASHIQGMTLWGVLFDEAALLPRSFVEQALARCSVTGSRFWFNCNPENPCHWFYKEWILKSEKKNALYLHFTMDDNPSLSESVKKRYGRLYSGSFHDRFIKGLWVLPEGIIYPEFNEEKHVVRKLPVAAGRYFVSCDYGTVNPCSMGLWCETKDGWCRIREYYYSGGKEGSPRTDEEHYAALERLCGDLPVEAVVIDPSAASFSECIRRRGRYRVIPAENDVLSGIRRVGKLLSDGRLLFHEGCKDSIREFSLYVWDVKSGRDRPVKENDHAMDDIRYFVSTVADKEEDDFFVVSLKR